LNSVCAPPPSPLPIAVMPEEYWFWIAARRPMPEVSASDPVAQVSLSSQPVP
jgi:hypothetical protein